MSQLTADCVRGKTGPCTSISKSGHLYAAQEGLTIFSKSFSLSYKYFKGYLVWWRSGLLFAQLHPARPALHSTAMPALIKIPSIGECPSAARHGLLQLIHHSISINKHGTNLWLSPFSGGSNNYLSVNGEGNCFKVTFMAGWHLSCKAENKSTHCGILSSSRGSSGSKSSSDTLKIKTKDNNNKNKKA